MPIAQECAMYGMRDLQSPLEYSLGKGGVFPIKTENVIKKKPTTKDGRGRTE